MANNQNFSFAHSGANAILSYRGSNSSYLAKLRASQVGYNYGVTSDESHSRDERAFYPHRRIQGTFRLVVDCKGYGEFKQLMAWLRGYADTVKNEALGTGSALSLMDVSVPARGFRRLGVLTQGINDHDHVGSNVFSCELTFVAAINPDDLSIPLVATKDVSKFTSPSSHAGESLAFYPLSSVGYVDSNLYDSQGVLATAAAAANIASKAAAGDISGRTGGAKFN